MATPTLTSDFGTWLPSDALRTLGFTPGGPERDYGMRWGADHAIRVSFAPHPDRDDGFVYGHDPVTDRSLLLAGHTTLDQVEAAWKEITARTMAPDGFLAFAALDQPTQPLSPSHAKALLWHCLDRELGAYREIDRAPDGRAHFDATHTLITYRSARASAEDLLDESVQGSLVGADPIVVRYRILGRPESTGRLYAENLDTAVTDTRQLTKLVERHGLSAQATSVSHGHTAVAAARIPQLSWASERAPVPSPTPDLSI